MPASPANIGPQTSFMGPSAGSVDSSVLGNLVGMEHMSERSPGVLGQRWGELDVGGTGQIPARRETTPSTAGRPVQRSRMSPAEVGVNPHDWK